MAVPHATSGQVIDLGPVDVSASVTTTLVKTDRLQVIRLVLPPGKEIPSHQVAGEITVQCLQGRVAFTAAGTTHELQPGQMCYLAGGTEHAVKGLDAATVLVTIML